MSGWKTKCPKCKETVKIPDYAECVDANELMHEHDGKEETFHVDWGPDFD